VYAEAKARGYDTKTMRAIVRLRKMETQARQEAEALLETYKAALGMDYAETPLGSAAVTHAVQRFRDSMAATGASKVTMQANGGEPVTVFERQTA
jgi:hypothetical protein